MDLVVYHPSHGFAENDFVYASWLDGNYYIEAKTDNTYKLSSSSGGLTIVQYTGTIFSGYVRLVTAGGSTTISSLDHLNGQIVTIVSGGEVVTTQEVQQGSVTIAIALTEYIVGLPYTFKVRTTRIEVPVEPTLQSRIKRISETAIRYIRTKGGKAGQEYGNKTYLNNMGATFSNESKDKTIATKGGFTEDAYTTIISDTPFPMTIIAAIISFEVEETR
jgi:hypothetical protein